MLSQSQADGKSHSCTLSDKDKATDALQKAGALLNVLSCTHDDSADTFIPRSIDVWLAALVARDLVGTAMEALTLPTK